MTVNRSSYKENDDMKRKKSVEDRVSELAHGFYVVKDYEHITEFDVAEDLSKHQKGKIKKETH